MGILPTPNHQALIRDCYPPYSSSSPGSLPQPVSNSLSKLAFYAINRPTKLSKVLAILLERANKARPGAGSGKARQELAVTTEIVRGLVVESGESGKEGSGELVKAALAETALKVAEMALGGAGGGATAQVKSGGKRDPELEARGASLFHAVATYLTPPFFGTSDGMGRQYLRCVSLLSSLAQLSGRENVESRYVALKALEGAAKSEFLYTTGGHYDTQVGEIVPALLSNLADVPVEDLRDEQSTILSSEKSLATLSSSLASRKTPSISPPSESPRLVSTALTSLLLLSRLSTLPQLLALHNSLATFLDRYSHGSLWHASSQAHVLFFARAIIAAARSSHRAAAVMWWSDQVGEIFENESPHRSVTLLFVLKHLVDPEADAHVGDERETGDLRVEGLSAAGILSTLADLLVRRARLSSPSVSPSASRIHSSAGTPRRSDTADTDDDPLLRPILTTVGALARASATTGYSTQLDDMAGDLIDLLRMLKNEEGRAERLVGGMNAEEKSRAKVKVVMALKALLQEAPAVEGAVATEEADTRTAATTSVVENGAPAHADEEDEERIRRPAAAEVNGRAAGIGAYGSNGLVLGKPVNGSSAGDVFSTPSSTTNEQRRRASVSSSKAADAPILRVQTPGGASTAPSGSPTHSTVNRHPISPRTFARSLFLLLEPDSHLRFEYAHAAAAYCKREMPISKGSTDELASFVKQVMAAVYGLAIGEVANAGSSAFNGEQQDQAAVGHALHRTRSVRSLRSRKSFLDGSPQKPSASAATGGSGPTAADYSSLTTLLDALFSRRSSTAVLEALPALLALDAKAATRWEVGLAGQGELGSADGGPDAVRAQACREVAARAIGGIGRTWVLGELQELAQDVLDTLSPSVIPTRSSPSSTFASRPSPNPAALNASLAIDILATDREMQKASALDRTSLASLLGQPWSYETAKVEAVSAATRSPYLSGALPSRSLVNLGTASRTGSTYRLSSLPPVSPPSTTHGHGNGSSSPVLRRTSVTPSLADLQDSLGTSPRSARGSVAPSVSSSAYGLGTGGGSVYTLNDLKAGMAMASGVQQRRRTSRTTVDSVLDRVGRRSRTATGASQASLGVPQV
ncbi:cellular morphogenesis-related protein [Rhodotorula toruloides]|uniref:Cellular morphogenesis-related protein n=1 Tax=Rhodotorula toruloides TaxID=5286 RepID=A0A511KP68_RHOTO|nr:cellular morphogenesis-related protein [Rhodotorula toruloides]